MTLAQSERLSPREEARLHLSHLLRLPWAVPLGLAAIWMLLIWGIHRDSPRTLVSFHGFLHAAIADRFLVPGPVAFPPENPFFAGEPLPYYWFFQFVGAQVSRLTGWNVFYGLEAVILAATGTLMVTGVVLGRHLFGSTLCGALIGYLLVAGTNPLGFVFAGWAFITALFRSPERLQRLGDTSDYLWNVVHPMYSAIRFNDYGGLYGPLLNFFLNMTARPVGLAGLLALILAVSWALRHPGWWRLLGVAGVAALTCAFSPMPGIPGVGALVAGLVGSWLWGRWSAGELFSVRALIRSAPVGLVVALIAGMLVAAPTYYHLWVGPSDRGMQVWLSPADGLLNLATIVLSIGPLFALAVVGVARAPWRQREFLRALTLGAAALLFANALIMMQNGNHSNFFHAAVVLLSVPAAASVLWSPTAPGPWRSEAVRAAVVAAVFLPTTVLLLAAYVHRPALSADFQALRLARVPSDSALALLYRWIQEATGHDAIFVLDPGHQVTMAGNIAEFPEMTGRVLFTEHRDHYVVAPYPDADVRMGLAGRLLSGQAADDAERAYLSRFNRPIYLATGRADDAVTMDRLNSLYGEASFRNGSLAVFQWR